MARIVEKVHFENATKPTVKRVAAYARVSSAKDAMHHSLSAQISYYSSLIQKTPGWLYCGVYADEAMTGTKDDRENFQKLLSECRAGNIDLVITKSISRFARNTVTLLETVRELKEKGVDVFFEEQNLHTMSASGEVVMTVLASLAQAESLSASENQKWRIKKNFEEGKPWNYTIFGYRNENGILKVENSEAQVVRLIFQMYLDGCGLYAIRDFLNDSGISTRFNGTWTHRAVSVILKNITYTGNLILQKTYRENHITKVRKENNGQLPKYRATETHEAIIDMDTFMKVQDEMHRRKEKYNCGEKSADRYAFTGVIKCDCCGASYRRKVTASRVVWVCNTYNTNGKNCCPLSKQIPDETLKAIVADALGHDAFDDSWFECEVKSIQACENYILKIEKRDGAVVKAVWTPPSRKDSWTQEKRETARRRAKGEIVCQ